MIDGPGLAVPQMTQRKREIGEDMLKESKKRGNKKKKEINGKQELGIEMGDAFAFGTSVTLLLPSYNLFLNLWGIPASPRA